MKRILTCVFAVMLLCLTACSSAGNTVDLTISRSSRNVTFLAPTVYSLDTLCEAATYVVEAEVLATQNSEELGVHAYFIATVTVASSLKGDLSGEILISDTGTMDENGERTCIAEPLMLAGHRVLLFLKGSSLETEDGQTVYELIDGPVSKFFYDKDGKYHNALTYSEVYEELAKDGTPSVPTLADLSPLTIDIVRNTMA